MKILFTNCYLLKRNPERYQVLKNAYLSVENDTITYIGEEKPTGKFDLIKDMTGKLLMPGLINAHGHSPMTLLRGVGSGLKLQDWLNNCIFPIESKMVAEDIYWGCKLAVAEMFASGTTCFSEMYDFPFASMAAIAETGIKSNVCRVGLCFDQNLEPNEWPRTQEIFDFLSFCNGKLNTCKELEEELTFLKSENSIKKALTDKRIIGDLCIHSQYLTTEKFVKKMSEVNKIFNVKTQIHISETKSEHLESIQKFGLTPIQYFQKYEILRDGLVYAAHCVHVSDEDLDIMQKTGTSLIHNPSSNLKLGSGIANIVKAMRHGVNVAIGTDGCASNNNLDMFEEMHLAAMLPTGTTNDPSIILPEQVIDMATINGAKAMGRNDIGKLEVGYKADIIAIDLTSPHLNPINDIPSLLIYSAHGSDVCMTMVNGKIVYENRQFTTLDIEEIKAKSAKISYRLIKD